MDSSFLVRVLLVSALTGVWSTSARAAELKPATAAAFEKYVAATEVRINKEIHTGAPFLFVDELPSQEKKNSYQQLQRGEVVIRRLKTQVSGEKFEVPDGLIHHWVGVAFIPGASLATALPILTDYDHRVEYFKPDVIASRVMERQGEHFKLFVRFNQRQFTTVVYNTEYDVLWTHLDPAHVVSRSASTRIAEVKDASRPDGPELPVDQGHGYLWRINTYFRFLERDGGLYIQCEAISLSRDLPTGLGWLLRPFVTTVPKHGLTRMLGQTRTVVQTQIKARAAQAKQAN
ncbi:MAG TPA: hypothetical protein VF532_16240 [Candidatus Angelobacter sp.]